MRVAVVGHVEWVELLRVDEFPSPGQIVHAARWWEGAAGGGPGSAVQLRELAGEATLFTALGDDDLGHRASEFLSDAGLRVEAVFRKEPTRRAIAHIDRYGERTITVVGERLAPFATDPLPWEMLVDMDAVYVTAGDVGAVKRARAARVLVATARTLPLLKEAKVPLDALVASAGDPGETYRKGDMEPPPELVVLTEGDKGGTFESRGEARRFAPADLKGEVVDRYGAGDAFAGALTYGLGAGMGAEEAIELAARCGAAVLERRGPFEFRG